MQNRKRDTADQTRLLDKIDSPSQVKQLPEESLPRLAEEIREVIIDTVSRTGGHLASSLGTVELTIALHYVFDAPRDKILWDVGHQSYAHKLLTGRRDRFHTLRQHGGISGFPRRAEGQYDVFDVGHSGTCISTALGVAEGQRQQNEPHNIIALVGDGSITNGLSFEGLNQAGHLKSKLIVILNDNEMSISPNVGALAAYLNRIITGQAYNKLHKQVMEFLRTIPSIGPTLVRVAKHAEESLKGLIVPGLLFEEMGFNYVGPIPGHNLPRLIEYLRNIKNLPLRPILLHVITKKGKGYVPAEQDPETFHGVGPFEKSTGKPLASPGAAKSYTDIFSDTLVELARADRRIVAITAGMTGGTGLKKFKELFPARFYDVGIAEQHAVAFAAGLAAEGLKPVAAIYSTFLQRTYDQIFHDVCLQNLPVVFAIDRAGIVGDDGPTHHGLFDLSFLRAFPHMVIMAPKDENELQHMLCTALQFNGPGAIRYPRGKVEDVRLDSDLRPVPIGKGEMLTEGSDLLIVGIGNTVAAALSAAALLEDRGIKATVVNSRFIKPLDEELICSLARKIGTIITVEENMLAGGFGSAILEMLEKNGVEGIKVKRIGIQDQFVEHGPQRLLREKYGLDNAGIYNTALSMLSSRNSKLSSARAIKAV